MTLLSEKGPEKKAKKMKYVEESYLYKIQW